MFDIWKSLKDFVSINQRKIHISNPIFQIHYKITVTILLLFSILVTSRQYLGDPIDCISSQDVKNIAERYCWIHSTFTRGREDDGRWSYEAVEEPLPPEISPGVRPALEGDRLIFQYYYQWVWCVLFIQAGMFYFPHWLWKYGERGRIKMLVADLNAAVIVDEDAAVKHREAILHYFSPNRGHHTFYAWRYVGCEVLCLANVLCQMFGLDAFLNNQFSTYGLRLFSLPHTRPFLRHDALARVFPTVTACRIATGGVAFGTVEYDLLCVLPINILNEKIYIFLWFWFIMVAVATLLNLIYRSLTLFFPTLRRFLLRRQARRIALAPYSDDLLLNLGYGDWFILHKLGENINPVVFGELLKDLAGKESEASGTSSPLTQPLMNSKV